MITPLKAGHTRLGQDWQTRLDQGWQTRLDPRLANEAWPKTGKPGFVDSKKLNLNLLSLYLNKTPYIILFFKNIYL